ncbi:hypothetical protein SCOR_15050 [Sulfidibacter corallicola]|uniref:Uncharacterized protein n=1 Tax=Sulfidibacter corallicola TaxID=2818388 RepID=A0A8A4TYP6_SULCO|nr:hypothetical protein [Sulfidibacter corallicola]QTD54214.1 hypothetical protein J3U87_17350 [Sulfidibacter corallicola]
MAYHSTAGTAQNSRDLMTILRQYLTDTVGWTLHDSQNDASPYFVVTATGESGKEDIYLYVSDDNNANRLGVRAYHYWNQASHQGTKPAYNSSYTYIRTSDGTPFLYWIFADLDHWFLVTKLGATYYGQYSGLISRFWSGEVAVAQSTLDTGTEVVAQVDDANHFEIGKPYLIRDNVDIERVEVTAIDTASTPHTVTLANVSRSFVVGSKIGEDPAPLIVGSNDSPSRFYATNRFDGYSGNSSHQGECKAADGGLAGSSNHDKRYGLTVMYPWLTAHTSQGYNELRGQLIEVYSVGSTNLDSEDVIQQGTETFRVFNLSSAGFCAVRE